MKFTVIIDAQFPQLKGGACNQRGRGQGSTVRTAGARAFANLLKQPTLRKKHWSTFTSVVSVGREVEIEQAKILEITSGVEEKL